jgi:hypothetical protein
MQLRRIKQIAEEEEAKALDKLLVLASAAREEQQREAVERAMAIEQQ